MYQEVTLFIGTRLLSDKARTVRPNIKSKAAEDLGLTKRKRRRSEYAKTQKLWQKSPALCLRTILKDARTDRPPQSDQLWSYWERVMTSRTPSQLASSRCGSKVLSQLWDPISSEEIKKSLPAKNTSPGPDGMRVKDLLSLPTRLMTRIFNIFLIIGKIPVCLLESRTTLIPKKHDACLPEEFRPITVSSVLVRTFHKVLVNRLQKHIKLNERQKAFRDIDGCAENILLLNMAL